MLRAAPHVLEQLDEHECRRLLSTAPHGRLVFTEGALPMVLPVTYAVRGDDIIASLIDVEVDRTIQGAVVAFEVDSYAPATQEGWCVSVVGPSRQISQPGLIAELDALGFAPYTPDLPRHYVAVQIALVRGRRLRLQSHKSPVVTRGMAEADGHA